MHQEVPSERTQRDHICRHRAGTTKTHRFTKQLDPTCRLVAMYVDVYIYIYTCMQQPMANSGYNWKENGAGDIPDKPSNK